MKTSYIPDRLIIFFLFALTVISCDSFVEVDLPKSQLTSEGVFKDFATADAALTDIYAKIRDKGILTGQNTGISCQLGNYTDDLVAYGTPTSTTVSFYNNAVLPSNSDVADYWNASYNQIYAANAILEGIAENISFTSQNKNKLQGEALFIRALMHFYLVNIFGDIPYIKNTDYTKNSLVSRMPAAAVYENITNDLKNAIELLPTSYSTTERIRPNKYTAQALLARVYLYVGKYVQAANEASSVLNQSGIFPLTKNINQVFQISSKETIWQLKAPVSGQNTQEADTFIFLSAPPAMTSLSDNLVNSFASSDLRRLNWIKEVKEENSVFYHPYKYKEQNFTSSSVEYSIVFRTAEQFLIRAEARAHQGDLTGAKDDLNKIRQRAGLLDTQAVTQSEILDAILCERKWEFFTEHGHRFFDLKRFNKIDEVLTGIKPGWKTTDRLLPIPQSELSANPNLRPQNAGY
ncbi:RagB/SusD family nutrient uptake outer membrane protein [Flavobacterium cheongpyeongense]|uniref:RagB/SusD family nutrient uptake outer membrane protein n=1 Tax=Flavobacterium cheongpyeongense TaxID=2212651 RepID=A0A2V4BSP2_9FLAO|nr:RagB/SusD family nutrient uptake outer membrane protein [Flavobacterium cheongpyeongense]PXY40863.1 RagB/SusD family nutrient uptake outer membrane protein [Flavobacterium cheongpyeongense]